MSCHVHPQGSNVVSIYHNGVEQSWFRFLRFMVFDATFNNIFVISSVLLVEETGGPRENHQPVSSH